MWKTFRLFLDSLMQKWVFSLDFAKKVWLRLWPFLDGDLLLVAFPNQTQGRKGHISMLHLRPCLLYGSTSAWVDRAAWQAPWVGRTSTEPPSTSLLNLVAADCTSSLQRLYPMAWGHFDPLDNLGRRRVQVAVYQRQRPPLSLWFRSHPFLNFGSVGSRTAKGR